VPVPVRLQGVVRPHRQPCLRRRAEISRRAARRRRATQSLPAADAGDGHGRQRGQGVRDDDDVHAHAAADAAGPHLR